MHRRLVAWLATGAWMVAGTVAATEPVAFDWFEYRGNDAVFEQPLPSGSYRNPILAGWYPDPSITRAGDRFYLVNSTFTYFPGIPIFESTDLVHWKQVGNAIHRPGQLDFDGLDVSRGVFAPAIEYHDGTFYVVNTSVDAGGNFIVTATNPAGPWSDPSWLPDIGGIDPSLFFDDDGKAYLLNNDEPEGPVRYDGHRAIWLQEIDIATKKPFGPRKVLIDGGVKPEEKPIWIEGPHIYRRNGWYYLMCAEGGTGPNHSQVILRSRNVWGPYLPYAGNPILTQRDLDPARPDPITNAGHADLVQMADGSWWATFLASRTYGGVHYNTGRETFLLPVEWRDDWPVILPAGQAIPYVEQGPASMERAASQAPLSGNFTWLDEFDAITLDPAWLQLRVPKRAWADTRTRPGTLLIEPGSVDLDGQGNPAFLGRRQQHLRFEASTSLQPPEDDNVEAGMVAFQGGHYWYFLGVRREGEGLQLFLRQAAGAAPRILASMPLARAEAVELKIAASAGAYSFGYRLPGQDWQWLLRDADGTVLSTDVAGGFVGVMLGPYAHVQ